MTFSAVGWQRILKVAILLLLIGSLTYHVVADDSLRALPTFWQHQEGNWYVLLLVLLLVPINWSVEAIKWQYLIRTFSSISFVQAYRGVLAGVSFALFTPNRMGEYLGRVWILDAKHRLKGIVVTLVNSMAQIIVTVGFGLVALLWWSKERVGLASPVAVVAGVSCFVILIGLYFSLSWMVKRLERWLPRWRQTKWFRTLSIVQYVPRQHLAKVLVLSSLRYLVYTGQYVLLLLTLTDLSFQIVAFAVPLLFFFQMGIPAPAILEIGVRGSLAANLLSPYGASVVSIVVATTSLWVMNLILPAICGGVIIATIKSREKYA